MQGNNVQAVWAIVLCISVLSAISDLPGAERFAGSFVYLAAAQRIADPGSPMPSKGGVATAAPTQGSPAKMVAPVLGKVPVRGAVLSPNAPAIAAGGIAPAKTPAKTVAPTKQPGNNSSPQTNTAAKSFIRPFGNKFVDDSCQLFAYTGWNGYNELLQAGLRVPAPSSVAAAPALLASQSDYATATFAEAVTAGMSVARVFAAGGDFQGIQLQPQPGVYNETVFRGIDYILAQAARYNIKIVLSIINNWDKVDGKGQFVAWANVGPDLFWTSPVVRGYYRAHLKALATRVNVFTGTAYKDDPTIFSWNLYNEPRNPDSQKGPGKPQPVTAWVNEMSAVLATLDPNHMITVGEEGFFVGDSSYTQYNPFGVPSNVEAGWAGRIGQDFLTQHSSPHISYAAFHFWPNNWNTVEPRFLPLWMDGHIRAANALGKPLVLEEFGKAAATNQDGTQLLSGPQALQNITVTRDPIFRQIYSYVENSLASGGPLRAALFWEWSRTTRSSPNSVLSSDSTFSIVKAHAANVAKFRGQTQAGCTRR